MSNPNFYNIEALSNWFTRLENLGSNEILDVNFIGDSVTTGAYANNGDEWDLDKFGYVGNIQSRFQNIFQEVGRGLKAPYYFWKYSGTWTQRIHWTFNGIGPSLAWGIPGWGSVSNTMNDTYGLFSAAAESIVANSVATLSFNGTGITILVQKTSDSGNISVQIDNGTPTIHNCNNSTPQIATIPITGLTAGEHILKITKFNDTTKFILLGAYEMKGTQGVRCNNMSIGAGTLQYISSDSINIMANSSLWNCPLTVIAMFINDGTGSVTNPILQNLVTAAKAVGDVLLVCPAFGDSSYSYGQTLANDIINFANDNNVACIDINAEFGGNDLYIWNPPFVNSEHPNFLGHQKQANSILDMILPDSMNNIPVPSISGKNLRRKLRI